MSEAFRKHREKVQDWVSIYLTPGPAEYQSIYEKMKATVGTDNRWEFPDVYHNLFKEHCETIAYTNMTLDEAETLAEPLRIAYPDRHVNIAASDTSFIGNVTWEDQMKMFWEYPTYTEIGAKLAKERKDEADRLGLKAAWE